jgi:hypothetical protein
VRDTLPSRRCSSCQVRASPEASTGLHPITLVFDHDILDAADMARVRAALATVHAPSWSVTFRCGVAARIEIETDTAASMAERMAALGSSGAWSLLDALGTDVEGSLVELGPRAVSRHRIAGSIRRNRTEISFSILESPERVHLDRGKSRG